MIDQPPTRRGYGAHCQPLEVRFWSKVRADTSNPDGCWLWTGGIDGKGYACIWLDRKSRIASRIAWELRHAKPFPEGMHACHKCDNPLCVRPDHIFPGTDLDNNRDARAKGRMRPRGKLTHCQRGHALVGDNIILEQGENRIIRKCRTCRRMKANERRARNRAKEIL